MKIKFLPQNVVVKATSGQSVRDIAKEQNLPVSSSCNGMCVCAECRVYVVEGENHILPPTEKEVELIGRGYVIDRRRLSCQLFCFGDVTVDLSEQVERAKHQGSITKQVLKKLSKTREEEVHSVGDVLIEKDQDMKKTTDVFEHSQQSSPRSQQYGSRENRMDMDFNPRAGQRGKSFGKRGQRWRRDSLQRKGGGPGFKSRFERSNPQAAGSPIPRSEEGAKPRAEGARSRAGGTQSRFERARFHAEGAKPRAEGTRSRAEGTKSRAEGRSRSEGGFPSFRSKKRGPASRRGFQKRNRPASSSFGGRKNRSF